MKNACLSGVALCLGLLSVPSPVSATVLVDDFWADGNRTTQNLPLDSAWFGSSASALAATAGSMSLVMPSGAVLALTYFTTNATSSPIQLALGDTLTVTLRLTFSGVAAQNSSQGFKIGLFDFADSSLSPKRVSADGFSNSSQGAGVQGYCLFQNMGVSFNNASPIDLRKRTTTSDSSLLGASGDYASLGTGPANTNSFNGFSSGITYTLQLAVQRTNSSSLLITATWVNTATGASLSSSALDSSATAFSFDGIALRPAGSASTASIITFSEVKVEVVSAATPPSIDLQPLDAAALTGDTVSFSVLAGGSAPLSYQWFLNASSPLLDATNSTLSLTNVQPADSGFYSVVVSNASGWVLSSNAALTVTAPVAPAIVTQPRDETVLPGETATFSVQAGGSEPLYYQWYANGTPLAANAAESALTLTNVQPSDAGIYWVVVSNRVAAVQSASATLTVNTAPVAPSFRTQPAPVVALAGDTVTFSAQVYGTAPLCYQWARDGVAIPGATNLVLVLNNVQLALAGSYTLTASNAVGSATSEVAVLTVTSSVPVAWSAYDLVGFGQATTGGGVLADTDPDYAKVYTATDLANAISSKTVKVIQIMNDLNLGYNEIEAAAKANSEPFRAHNSPKLHPRLLQTGVSLVDIQKKNGLTIFSTNGATIRHASFNIKSAGNVIVRNLKFDELWEWDEASKGDYDKNDWDFLDLGNSGTVSNIWIDHCTFTKAYDGICDVKEGSFNITFSWNKYAGDDGATNPNSWVWQQILSLESNRTSYAMYNFLRNNGFSPQDIVTIVQGHDKTHLVGATTDSINAQHTLTFHHQWYKNPWDRLPRLRGGNVHNFNLYVDDTEGLAARRLRNSRAAAMSTASQNTLNNTYSFNPFLNGSISTEGGALLVEKSVYIDCVTPLRNNQTDPSDAFYTGKVQALDTIYQMDNPDGTVTYVRGDSTNADNPLGPFQAPVIAFSWNLNAGQLPYSYTMDDPAKLKAMLTDPHVGAGAGVLTWDRTNWLRTAYAPTAPAIVQGPQSQAVAAGGSLTLSVVAGGSAPLACQWFFNNQTIPGATNDSLLLNNFQSAGVGAYTVVVTNFVGAATSAVAQVTLAVASGFSAWQSAHFTPAQLADVSLSGPSACPAGDGVANFVKYALGLEAFTAVKTPLVGFQFDGSEGVLRYSKPASVTDVSYQVQVSTNLLDWSTRPVTVELLGTDPVTGLQNWQARCPAPGSSTCYFRLTVSQ